MNLCHSCYSFLIPCSNNDNSVNLCVKPVAQQTHLMKVTRGITYCSKVTPYAEGKKPRGTKAKVKLQIGQTNITDISSINMCVILHSFGVLESEFYIIPNTSKCFSSVLRF